MEDSDTDDRLLLEGDPQAEQGESAALLLDANAPSILDEYGEEMTAVLTPVSLWCVWTSALRARHTDSVHAAWH